MIHTSTYIVYVCMQAPDLNPGLLILLRFLYARWKRASSVNQQRYAEILQVLRDMYHR